MEKYAYLQSHHLLIVTDKRVLSWDTSGLRTVHTPASGGVSAARQAHHGGRVLAVAGSQGVAVFDGDIGACLQPASGLIKHAARALQFPNHDGASLDEIYVLTEDKHAVRRINLREQRVFDCGPLHPSRPTAYALSSRARMLLSASDGPPTVYLTNLEFGTAARLVAPQVSSAVATCAAFHPQWPNIFLLGFKDGSLGVYDANKLPVSTSHNTSADQASMEIKGFPKLHHLPAIASNRKPGSGQTGTEASQVGAQLTAQFLPHARSQIITGGSDGKCRIVDFQKGTVLRSWHVKGPITAMAILHVSDVVDGAKKVRRPQAIARDSRLVIAVGRLDGRVLLFNELGMLLAERVIGEGAEHILDVDFVPGPGPTVTRSQISETAQSKMQASNVKLPAQTGTPTPRDDEHCASALAVATLEPKQVQSKFKEHLSRSQLELGETIGTVKHVEMTHCSQPVLPLPSSRGYMDLFSPVKQPVALRASPPRSRPRITSKTYTRHVPEAAIPFAIALESCSALSPVDTTIRPSQNDIVHSKEHVKTPASESQVDRLGSVSNISHGLLVSQRSTRPSPISSRSSSNSKILAELQRLDKLGKTSGARKTGGSLAIFAPHKEARHHMSSHSSAATSRHGSDRKFPNRGPAIARSKRVSIGRVKVQQPTRLRPRPAIYADELDQLLLTEDDTERPDARLPRVHNIDGPRDTDTQTTSSVPSHDPEEQVYSKFSSDSSLLESPIPTMSTRGVQLQDPSAPPGLSEAALAGEDTSSSATPVEYHGRDTSTEESNVSRLEPGFAQSFEGPVEVAAYLPRRNSLKFASPSRQVRRHRHPLSVIEMSSARLNRNDAGDSPKRHAQVSEDKTFQLDACAGCCSLREEMDAMKKRQALLEEEVVLLRRLVKGSDCCVMHSL